MKHHLKRHVDFKRCKVLKSNPSKAMEEEVKVLKINPSQAMEEEVKLLRKQIEDLKLTVSNVSSLEKRLEIQENKPIISQNILNVICVKNNDNYLDVLTERTGNFEQAIDYIKDCALSDLTGDCKLIEKIYMNEAEQKINNIYFSNGRNKVTYFNENMEQTNDNRTSFGRKLANNLQKSYLKGINYLINKKLVEQSNPSKFLEEYDLLTWNNHIYNLSDIHYQKKIINQLSIPVQPDI
jgi:hypothetical protein